MRRNLRLVMAALLGALAVSAAPAVVVPATGVVVDGHDWMWARLPPAAKVESYRNDGYTMRVEEGAVLVEVSSEPLESQALFLPPSIRLGGPSDPIVAVARTVTAGASRRYDAVSRVLTWVASNVRYELDRSAPQDARAVLERRSAYCTGAARLTVALLGAVGITAREVPGYVVGEGGGYHRWVEVYYPDRGWSFSDPARYHHYVPATYVRLADERLGEGELEGAEVLRREDLRRPVDLYSAGPVGVSARRNNERQQSAALRVRVAGQRAGTAILEGQGVRRTLALTGGEAHFVGLEPGEYLLEVLASDRPPERRKIVFRDRVVGAVFIEPAS